MRYILGKWMKYLGEEEEEKEKEVYIGVVGNVYREGGQDIEGWRRYI